MSIKAGIIRSGLALLSALAAATLVLAAPPAIAQAKGAAISEGDGLGVSRSAVAAQTAPPTSLKKSGPSCDDCAKLDQAIAAIDNKIVAEKRLLAASQGDPMAWKTALGARQAIQDLQSKRAALESQKALCKRPCDKPASGGAPMGDPSALPGDAGQQQPACGDCARLDRDIATLDERIDELKRQRAKLEAQKAKCQHDCNPGQPHKP
jgi:hypothetical protein